MWISLVGGSGDGLLVQVADCLTYTFVAPDGRVQVYDRRTVSHVSPDDDATPHVTFVPREPDPDPRQPSTPLGRHFLLPGASNAGF